MCDKTIHTGGIPFISTTIKIAVKRADIFSAKTFDDKDDYIFLREACRISIANVMDRRIYCCHFSLAIEIVWYGKLVYIDGT